ncbi:MAG: PLP-dependent aminotransferase family protein [Pseudomonadota bacterium]
MLRPWELEIELLRNSDTSIHVQIAQKIIEEIQHGRFAVGSALPGTRELATILGVNRKTVVQAYEEMIAQGWLHSEHKRGTFVSPRILSVNHHPKPTTKINYGFQNKSQAEPVISANKKIESDIISFSSGLSDSRLMPLEVLSRAMRHALIVSIRTNKQSYNEPKGSMILRQAILHMLNMDRGLHTDIDNICVVRGSQMGFFLVARVLMRNGDNIVMEKLCDQLASDAFKSCGANIIPVGQNDNGIDLDELEALCKHTKVRAVYVSPHYQIPTTVSMPMAHRRRLLAMADQYDFLIIEDDHDFEFNFSNKPILPLASFDKSNRVIYVGSLSKVLAPGFRIGFIAAHKEITKQFASEIMMIDRQGNTVTELAIAELLHTGEINRHTVKTFKIYDERRTYIAKLIREELKDFVTFKLPDGGLALWLKVNPNINMQLLVKDAEIEKVRIVAGASFCGNREQISAIRLGFANLTNDEVHLGIKRLKNAFQRQSFQTLNG